MSKTFWRLLSCYQPSPSKFTLDVSLALWMTERETENRGHKIVKQKLLPVFPLISFKLVGPTSHPNQCVIRWFSCLSLRANLGCDILITVNGHYKFTICIYSIPVYTLEMDRYHFLPIFPIRVFVLKLFADTDTNTDTIH